MAKDFVLYPDGVMPSSVALGPSLAYTAGAASRAVADTPGRISKSVMDALRGVGREFSAGYSGAPQPVDAATVPQATAPQAQAQATAPQAQAQATTPQAPSPPPNPVLEQGKQMDDWRKRTTTSQNPGYVAPAGQGTGTMGGVTKQIDNSYGNAVNVFSSLPVYQSAAPTSYPRSYAPEETQQRSRALDEAVAGLVDRVQRPVTSYGDLFQRKGALSALSALSGLAQGAGSNAVTAAGNQLQADTQSRSQDIMSRGQDLQAAAEGQRNVTTRRGQDLQFESTLGGQNVQREGNYLRELFAKYQADTQASTAQAQLDTQAEIAQKNAQAAEISAQMKYPAAPLINAYLRGRDLNGDPLTPQSRAQIERQLQLVLKTDPLSAALAGQVGGQ